MKEMDMSALLVDDLIVPLPTRPASTGWRHVGPGQARPQLAAVPAPRAPVRTRTSAPAAQLRLTDRGIAVIVMFFLALIATAAVVLVTSFLSVSNDPLPARGEVPTLVSSQA
jgi:hypothetical protein